MHFVVSKYLNSVAVHMQLVWISNNLNNKIWWKNAALRIILCRQAAINSTKSIQSMQGRLMYKMSYKKPKQKSIRGYRSLHPNTKFVFVLFSLFAENRAINWNFAIVDIKQKQRETCWTYRISEWRNKLEITLGMEKQYDLNKSKAKKNECACWQIIEVYMKKCVDEAVHTIVGFAGVRWTIRKSKWRRNNSIIYWTWKVWDFSHESNVIDRFFFLQQYKF